MQGIPCVTCRHALNDEVAVKAFGLVKIITGLNNNVRFLFTVNFVLVLVVVEVLDFVREVFRRVGVVGFKPGIGLFGRLGVGGRVVHRVF